MANSLDSVLSELSRARSEFEREVGEAASPADVEAVRVKYLGRKGLVSQLFRYMENVPAEEKPRLGEELNKLKSRLQERFDSISAAAGSKTGMGQWVDLTLPGDMPAIGYRNPLLQVYEEIEQILRDMGFSVETGPLVETEYYNFQALNIPDDHPAKDLQDTFYLEGGKLLRTHTSPVQIRTMERQPPPIRMIAPGRCFRKDAPDATHSPEFTQIEGLVIDRGISFAHLKGTLMAFAQQLFGEHTRVRFRPSFFPFTEPSAEMDVWWESARGGRWLEILGCGMVDPNVFGYVDYDPEEFSGFAWGMGVERIAMLKYQIDDIRHFFENDLRFLNQF
jgi:phenylalanyl-tRNA synthetase alpha chain